MGNKIEIIPVIYKTVIGKYKEQYKNSQRVNNKTSLDILIQLGKAYAEFGLFQNAKECLQEAMDYDNNNKDLMQRCNAVYKYVEGVDFLTNKPVQAPETIIKHFEKIYHLCKEDGEGLRSRRMIKRFYEYLGDKNYHDRQYEKAIAYYREALKYSPHELKLYRKTNSIQMKDMIEEYFKLIDRKYQKLNYKESEDWKMYKLGVALEVFYDKARCSNFSCRSPWLVFYRRTVLHGEKPSYKLAVLIELLRLHRKLVKANDKELSTLLDEDFKINKKEISLILNYRKTNKKFYSIEELYLIKGLGLRCLSKIFFPDVKVESQNELEDSEIPLTISIVEAMERRAEIILEELRERYREDAQEYQYALAESYHYVGLALYDVGDDEGAKIYYEEAIKHFNTVIQRFKGLALVHAQYRIGELYEEMALLFEKMSANYYNKAIDAYTHITDEQKSNKLFGHIRGLISVRIDHAKSKVEYIEKELALNST